MNNPLVSVIITSFRRSALIGSAVRQVLMQSYPELEIIVIDDNGLGTEEQLRTEQAIVAEFENKVSYEALKQNSGAQLARNFGASVASGDLLAFFDDDDQWEPTKISLQVERFLEHPDAGFIYCFQQAKAVDSGKVLFETRHSFGEGFIYKNLLHLENGTLATPNPLINKKAFFEAGEFDPNQQSAQDIDLFLRISKIYPVYLVPQVLHFALVHAGDRISTGHSRKLNGFDGLIRKFGTDMDAQTLKHIYSRKLFHAFWLKDFAVASESYRYLAGNHQVSTKYKLFYWGCRIKLLGTFIRLYFRYLVK